MIAVEKLTLSDLPPVLRHLHQAEGHGNQGNQAVDTIPSPGKLGPGDCYSYSVEEKRQLEKDMRAIGLLNAVKAHWRHHSGAR